jgi:transposase
MQRGGRPGCSGGLPRANGRKRRVCRWRRQAQNPSGRLRQSQGTSLSDLERIYQRKKEANKELSTLLAATGTSLTSLHGVGPSGAARLLAEVGQVTRFPTRAHFASWNGTAPIDASSGDQVRHRLSRAGNRQINRVLHIMAVVQLRNPTQGRAYYDRKVAAGKTPREAMRALKRRLSDVACRQMTTDAKARETGPGGHVGAAADSGAAGLHPSTGTSEKSLPGPAIHDLMPPEPAHSPGRSRRPSPAPDRSRRQAQSA